MNESGSKTPKEAPDEHAFTRFLQGLAERSEDLNDLAGEMMAKLRKRLISEMRRRSVWAGRPSYVGIYGYPEWTTEDDGPLAEILQDCYRYLFVDRLARLMVHLKDSGAIDGLVVTYLKAFIRDRRREHDPLGYHLYGIVQRAVREAVEARELHVLLGPEKIRNDTVLGTDAGADAGQAVSEEDLRPVVARWNNALMPGLVTAQRRELRQVRENLLGYLVDIEAEGIAVFSFKALIDALKRDVRGRLGKAFDVAEGETAQQGDDANEIVRVFLPETRRDDIERFRTLIACVAEGIQRLDRQRRTRRHLERLWTYLRRVAKYTEEQRLPSMRHLESVLKISRDRLPGHLETLRDLVRQCRGGSHA